MRRSSSIFAFSIIPNIPKAVKVKLTTNLDGEYFTVITYVSLRGVTINFKLNLTPRSYQEARLNKLPLMAFLWNILLQSYMMRDGVVESGRRRMEQKKEEKKTNERKCSLNIAIKLKNVPFALENFINDFYTFSCGLGSLNRYIRNYMHKTFSFHRKQTQFSNFATGLHVEN